MNYKEFINAIRKLNEDSYSFGNETLYKMAADIGKNMHDSENLSGAIWLIGRAYAASPQRRSYGKIESKTVWPVRTSNDGRDSFFDFIAKKINLKDCLPEMQDKYQKNEYKFDSKDEDIALLRQAIITVLKFNLELSKAIECFDNVPNDNVFKGAKVYCSNHISFCSKFLHFFFPKAIFIIDNYAYEGGKLLFNGNEDEKWRYICNPENLASLSPLEVQANPEGFRFSQEIYDEFSKDDKVKTLVGAVVSNDKVKAVLKQYTDRKRNTEDGEYKAQNYIEHCVRSYFLACKINKEKIVPLNQIKKGKLNSMPRLTDTVFLNIKKGLTKKEIEKYRDIHNDFKLYSEFEKLEPL